MKRSAYKSKNNRSFDHLPVIVLVRLCKLTKCVVINRISGWKRWEVLTRSPSLTIINFITLRVIKSNINSKYSGELVVVEGARRLEPGVFPVFPSEGGKFLKICRLHAINGVYCMLLLLVAKVQWLGYKKININEIDITS